MEKDKVIEILNELRDNVQGMRETGETDMSSVVGLIDHSINKTYITCKSDF